MNSEETNNPVVEYLTEHKNVILSVRNLAKRLSILPKSVCYHYFKEQELANKKNREPLIHKVRNVDVGSSRFCGRNQVQLLSA